MVTANELLASMTEVDRTFVIDNDLRTIKTPASITNLGVQSDDDVMTVYFQMPGTYCGIDLSEFNIRINYLNGAGEGDYHDVDDAAVQSDGTIRFSWTIGRHAASVVGNVEFNVCMKKSDSSGNVIKEFNTTTASLPILKGLEVSEQVISEYTDILEQWRAKLFGVGDTEEARLIEVSQEQQQVISEQSATILSDIELKGSETLATIPDTYTEVYNMAEEALRTKADAIVLEAEGTVITLNDSSDDHLQNLKVFGRTTQDGIPTPDAPVELVSVENPTVEVYADNIFDIAKFVKNARDNGKGTAIQQIDDTIRVMVASYLEDFTKYDFGFKPGIRYTISLNSYWDNATDSTSQFNVLFYYTDGTNTSINVKYADGATTHFAVSDAGKTVQYISIGTWRHAGLCILSNINLVEGVYEPNTMPVYKTCEPQSLTLNHTLHGIPVTSGGNYTDENGQQWICDEVDLERGVYIQRVGRLVLDGNSAWNLYNYETQYYGFHIWDTLDEQHQRSPGLCNQFETVGGSSKDCLWVGVTNKNIYAISKEWYDKGLDAWKAHLSETPLEVIYPRITPVETPLTSEEILAYKKLKTNRTNTTVLNDHNARMAIAYSADTLTFLRDNQPKPTDEQVEAAVNEYADEHGVQVPNDDYIKNLAEQVAASALDIFRSNLKPAKIGEVTLPATAWVGEANLYSQVVSIDGITKYSQVDLTPDVQQLAVFYEKDITFVTENEDGVVTVYAIGQKPTNDYTIQVTITEVEV